MAFNKKKPDFIDEENTSDEIPQLSENDSTPAAPVPETFMPQNKATRLAALIKQGNQTKEALMTAIDVNAAGLASQLSYLNTRGLNIAEVDPVKAEFPMKNDDGIYYMGTFGDYMAKRGTGTSGLAKTRTVAELKEFAQKREDTASNKAAKALDRLNTNPGDASLDLKYRIADLELQLAGQMLAAVERGDYSYESCKVSDA